MALNRENLSSFIRESLNIGATPLTDDTCLFSSGLVDSISMVELVMYIETESGVKLSLSDITVENLDSVGAILRLIELRRSP
jgi:acyl carrier protein